MSGDALRVLRLGGYLALTLPLMPVQAFLLWRKSPRAARLPLLYHGWICRLLGVRIARRGARSSHRPTLFVANHTSYLDIEILGATIEGSFVAKAEVAGWPIFGQLARLQRTVFVERADRAGVGRQRDEIRRRLADGDNLVLFPEGTSGDGVHMRPFKSALFAAAEDERVVVQPVSVVYRQLDGIPLGRFYRPFFAWYGEMTMPPHLWKMLGLGRLTVAVTFHEQVRLKDCGSRKKLADYCACAIADGLAAGLAGRDTGRAERRPVAALAAS